MTAVGDLAARHIGKRVRVQRFEGVLSGIFATSMRPIILTPARRPSAPPPEPDQQRPRTARKDLA